MLAQERFGKALRRVAHGRVPHPAPAHLPAPGDGMICAHFPAGDRWIHPPWPARGRSPRGRARKIIPLIHARPPGGQPGGRRLARVFDQDRPRNNCRMVGKRAAKHFPIPGPFIFAGQGSEDGAMNRGQATSAEDIILKRGLLFRVKHFPRDTQQHDGLVARQVCRA